MDDAKTIGARIRHARMKSGLTQVELAVAIGVSRAHLTNVEGGNGGLSLEKLAALALETGTTVAWLIGESETSDPKEAELLAAYHRMSSEKRDALLVVALALALAPPDQALDPTPNPTVAPERRGADCDAPPVTRLRAR